MNRHRQISKLLPAFVLGELDQSQVAAVQAHLAECAECARESERLETLLTHAASLGEKSVDQQMCASAGQKVLLAATQEKTERPHHGPRSGGALIWRIVMKNGTAKLAVAALIALAVVLGLSVFTGGGGSTAYAQVVDLLQKAHTMTFSVVNKTGVESMPTVRTEVAIKEPGCARTTTADGYVTIVRESEDGVKGINYFPPEKKYTVFEFTNAPDHPDTGPYTSAEKLRALPEQADEALGQKQIDARLLEGYRVHEDDVTTTVWIDPATGELARVEMAFASAPGMDMILSDFQFNVPLDDSLFSLEPPADYTPLGEVLQADVAETTEADLMAFLRLWSNWTVDRTFPPTVSGPELPKVMMQMAREGKLIGPKPPGYEDDQFQPIMYRGMVFMSKLPMGTWRYAGQNVVFGDPQTPIFWYRPAGSPTYRVIYADLSVADVAPENLPN